ncbi:kinase-like protein [Gigaspora margarita]|uniref:Kinase-like protein n=1 Tax=Gigaspora margarita TaxID=4874 RepID=A0A8H4EI52_GIGMA|nr:kinase-like protein [Gigaspora margarita]
MNQKIRDDYNASNTHVCTICNSESAPELPICNTKLLEDRLRRYEDETGQINDASTLKDRVSYLRKHRENHVSKAIINIEDSMSVDLCFVLDCTGSMSPYIEAAKEHILKMASYVNRNNSNIKFWVSFCGYRDHYNRSDRLQILDFTDSLEKFKTYITNKVTAISNNDIAEDVLGGLNAAITEMTWSNANRVLIHIGDAPPHGRRFNTNLTDNYPDGDPNDLTAESVLKKMQLKKILYFFGKINTSTDVMLNVFREIIGEFPVFDLMTMGYKPEVLVNKFCRATSSAIFSSITLTTTLRNSKSIYSLQRKKLQINPHEPDWTTYSVKTGKLLCCIPPKTLTEIKDEYYSMQSSFIEQEISFKLAPQPFSVGAERYAYFALDTSLGRTNKLVIKKYHDIKIGTIEKYLESVEISNIAHFFSTKFNTAAKRVGINKKVTFIDVRVLYDKTNNAYYSVEKYIDNAKFKKFNANSGLITEFHSILEAFAHFTYKYTEGYLVVYDLQGVDLHNEFLLTDPAIHCVDLLRFGNSNLGKSGIQKCFLAKHECNDICRKLELTNDILEVRWG